MTLIEHWMFTNAFVKPQQFSLNVKIFKPTEYEAKLLRNLSKKVDKFKDLQHENLES